MRSKAGRLMVITVLMAALGPWLSAAAAPSPAVGTGAQDLTGQFEQDLEAIRSRLAIPGMSAAVVRDGELVWARGFGYADVEQKIEAAPDTPYGLASVTKPVAAVLVMQLVEEGLIDLDAPVSRYGVLVGEGDAVTTRHLLTHTSENVPGTIHIYDGNRYALLGSVVEAATGEHFATLLSERILEPAGMDNAALNPFASWGELTGSSVLDFARLVGWGKRGKQTADVYARLAQPYQLDAQFETVPGMYQLYYSPAAGLLASVTDLARFDMALSGGQLLEEASRAEMWAPATSTYHGRPDLAYGLGWYVQELEGIRLQWHSGRWPPSTSALYLRAPDQGLAFIVLANTDNLTVPFHGIGNGDIGGSSLALAFMRHWVLPAALGITLPVLDWEADQGTLTETLRPVEDETVRRFLERELWSARQAFASVGRTGQAAKLWAVSLRAFPVSDLRGDPLYTQTAGPSPAVGLTVQAATLVGASRAVAVWLALVAGSIVVMTGRLTRRPGDSWVGRARWMAGTLILGPFALLIDGLMEQGGDGERPAAWRQALGASVWVIGGYALAWAVAIALLVNPGEASHPLMILGIGYLTPLAAGLVWIRVPHALAQDGAGLGRRLAGGALAEITTLNLAFAVLFPLTLWASEMLTATPTPTSPYLWALLSTGGVALVAILFPLHWWMARHGMLFWPGGEDDEGEAPARRLRLKSWIALAATLAVMVAALAGTIAWAG